jgi:hypothetical protein
MTTKRKPRAATKGKAGAEEFDALAHHIAEALRIMETSDLIPARIYNYFADAWNELANLGFNDSLCNSEAYARLVLAQLAQKGGAR